MSKPWVQIETPRQQQKEMLKAVTVTLSAKEYSGYKATYKNRLI